MGNGLIVKRLNDDAIFRGAFFKSPSEALQSYNIKVEEAKIETLESLVDSTVKHLVSLLEESSNKTAWINDCDNCDGSCGNI